MKIRCFVGTSVLTMVVMAWNPSSSSANSPKAIFDALDKEAIGLLGKDIRLDVETGLWWANLDGGLSSVVDSWNTLEGYDSTLTEASQSIGTGKGVVKQVGVSVQLKDNYMALNYLSDRLVEFAQDEADERVDNPLARSLLEQFIGELRPDLSELADLDATVWVRGEYGRFRGKIDNPSAFRARNGRPYFPQKDEGWQTDYYAFEIGMFPYEDEGETWKAGFYGRYRNFSRPLIAGYGDSLDEVHLQDADVTIIEFGLRTEGVFCDTFCWTLEGTMVPFTGVAVLDLGDLGWGSSIPLTLGGNIELSYPLGLGGTLFLPYAGFRAEYVMPGNPQLGADLTSVFDDVNSDTVDATSNISIGVPDYFFWGPTVGLNISL